MFAAEARGEVPPGTAKEWEHATPKGKKLPERVKKKHGHKKKAFDAFFDSFLKSLSENNVHPAVAGVLAKQAADKIATIGDWVSASPLLALGIGAAGTVGVPYAVGQAAGTLGANIRDGMDKDKLDTYRYAAMAREYRRRAAMLKNQGINPPQPIAG